MPRNAITEHSERKGLRGRGAVTDKDREGVEGNLMNCIKMSNVTGTCFI